MINILVTGVGGFIGKRLFADLTKSKKYKVITFDKEENYFFKPENLLRLVKSSDVIYHLAAISDPADKDVINLNLSTTQNLLDAIKKAGNKPLLVFPSTFAVYKTPQKGDVIKENFKVEPRNKYGLSKLMCEKLIKRSVEKKLLRAVILRFSNVYGPGAKSGGHSVIATFIDRIKNNKPLIIRGSGQQTRDFIYVKDVVRALILAMTVEKDILVLNICSGEEVNILRLVSLLQKISGKKSTIIKKEVDMSSEGFWGGNFSIAKKILGWLPRVSFEKGLRNTWRRT